jgi:methyl-accepting chemotaxis protein
MRKNQSVSRQLMLYITIGMVSVSLIIITLVGRSLYTDNAVQTENRITALSEQTAIYAEKEMMNVTRATETLAAMLGNYATIPEQMRAVSISNAVQNLVTVADYPCAWARWNAGSFSTGKYPYTTCWIKTKDGAEDNDIGDAGEWYQTTLDTPLAWINEPSEGTYDGEKVLVTSAYKRITDMYGNPVGVAGIDLDLNSLNKKLSEVTSSEGTTSLFLSAHGAVMSSQTGEKLGSISTLYTDPATAPYFSDVRQKKASLAFNSATGLKTRIVIVPVYVDRTDNPWFYITRTPYTAIVKTAQAAVRMIVIAILLEISIVLFLVSQIIRSIIKPLNTAAGALHNISEGDGDLTIRLKITKKDEVGQLSDSFNKTMDKIGSSITLIKKESEIMKHVGSELTESMSETADAVATITDGISSVQDQMLEQSAGVSETKATITQIVKNIEYLNTSIDAQAASVSESSSAIEEMAANITSVSTILQNNQTSMKNLESSSESGLTSVTEAAQLAHEIAEKSIVLEETSSVIKNIAGQTNLLAMNAAIEAAHAGGQGQGFAVVADEIRKLAEESTVQGEKIQQVLSEVKNSIDALASATEKTENQFNSIFKLTKTVSEQESVINTAMMQQNEGNTQILSAIKQITTITSEVKSGSAEMLRGSHEIATEMDKLHQMTEVVQESMNDMNNKTTSIDAAVKKIRTITGKNTESIAALTAGVSKFKV